MSLHDWLTFGITSMGVLAAVYVAAGMWTTYQLLHAQSWLERTVFGTLILLYGGLFWGCARMVVTGWSML